MSRLVIAFAGAKGSGKSAISHALAERLHVQRVGFGDYIRNEAQRRGLPNTTEALQALGELLISKGWEPFCTKVLAQAPWNRNEDLIVDGIRHVQAIWTLRKITAPAELFLIFVNTDVTVRLARLETRDLVSKADLQKIEAHSTEADAKQELPERANLIIDGTRPLPELLRTLEEILRHI
jgi:dephospho-CoA kinase